MKLVVLWDNEIPLWWNHTLGAYDMRYRKQRTMVMGSMFSLRSRNLLGVYQMHPAKTDLSNIQ